MPSDDPGSVTRWLGDLKGGEPGAAQPLWERYFRRLVRLAHRRLRLARHPGAEADEEDAALNAFDSFCRAAAEDRFPQLADRDDLWRVLVALTERKAADQIRRGRRLKRGGGAVRREADLHVDDPSGAPAGLDRFAGPEPTPEFAAMVADEFRRLLAALGDDELRRTAIWKLEGHTTEEIARKLGCARRTVARRLALIRSLWRAESFRGWHIASSADDETGEGISSVPPEAARRRAAGRDDDGRGSPG
jgi:DNA-directed RNA polymerase specialized sigma24 family protein